MSWAAITLFLNNALGWVLSNWKLILYVLAGVVVLVVLVFAYKGCTGETREIKLDTGKITKINRADELERQAEVEDAIRANAEVIKTVDGRTISTIENINEREKEIDKATKAADKKIADAKRTRGNVTEDELECILIGKC